MVSEETIVTYATNGSVNPEVMKIALESILGTQAKSTADASSSTPSNNASEQRSRPQARGCLPTLPRFSVALKPSESFGAERAGPQAVSAGEAEFPVVDFPADLAAWRDSPGGGGGRPGGGGAPGRGGGR